MPVVVNDFEVVTPSEPEQPAARTGPGPAPGGNPQELLKLVDEHLRTRREREERLHAT